MKPVRGGNRKEAGSQAALPRSPHGGAAEGTIFYWLGRPLDPKLQWLLQPTVYLIAAPSFALGPTYMYYD